MNSVGTGSWVPPRDLQAERLTVVACTPHYFGDDYVKPFDVPKELGIDLSCNFSTDQALLDKADACWFHAPSITRLPKEKKQPWILMSMESDRNWPILANPEVLGRFDLHMTYRLDSDVPALYPNWKQYGDFRRPPIPVDGKSKRSPAVYIASNPVAYRDAYVRQLMAHMPIDALGSCLNNRSIAGFVRRGNARCKGGFASILDVLPGYKFYLAFENSLSRDYVTERLFHALAAGTVPVYCGAENIDDFLPGDNAVINVRDFAGPRELADYLLYLDQDDQAYQRYLEWKDRDYCASFERLLDIGTIDPLHRMAVKLAHRCPGTCTCGGRLRAQPQEIDP
jgi:hypothetical protein